MAKQKPAAAPSIHTAIAQLPRKAPLKERLSRWIRKMLLRAGLLFLVLIGSCIALLALVPRSDRQSGSPPAIITRSPESPAQRPASSSPSQTSKIPSASRGFEESAAEKAYEQRTGREVVHLKDGTTYERAQPKRSGK